jgi:DNA-binding transcriptional MerR regulator
MVQSQGSRLRDVPVAEEARAMTDRRMKIGNFAQVVGVSIDAVRFYERRGVLPPAPRTAGGYRTFVQRDVDRVRLARQLQQLGLTIDQVVDALAAHDGNGATCRSERWRLEQVESRIDAQMAALEHTRRLIQDALAACDAGRCQLMATESPEAGRRSDA